MVNIRSFFKKLFKHRHKWVLIPSIWPYPYGYMSYCKKCRTALDYFETEDEGLARIKDYEAKQKAGKIY